MIHFAAAIEILACTGAGFSTLYLTWLRKRNSPAAGAPSVRNETEMLRLQAKFGYNEHSFIGISVQSEIWYDPDGRGAISYTERGNIWLVAGEPLAATENLLAVTREFLACARSRKKSIAFLPATSRFAKVLTGEQFRIIKVGASPYFDLQNWDPRGNSSKHLRSGVNAARREGVAVTPSTLITPELRVEVDQLSDEWTKGRRAGAGFRWLFELMPFHNSEAKRYFFARNSMGKLVGLLAASPMPARAGWYLEDVLRSSDAPRGTSDLLVFEALRWLAAHGAKLATLGTVPLCDKGTDETLNTGQSIILEKILSVSKRRLSSLYNFEGLANFKSKFVPTWWESEYAIVSKGHFISPRVANAIINVAIPGGLIQILQAVLFS